MNILLRLVLPALVAVSVTAGLAAAPAISPGESLVYKVGWALFPGAGEIRISAEETTLPGNRPGIAVTTATETKGIARVFLTFDATALSLFDAGTDRLISSTETSQANEKHTETSLFFDYTHRTANFVNSVRPDQSRVLPMPPGDPVDLIMGLIQAREWNLHPGEQRDTLVIFGDEFYELTLHAETIEEVYTPLGTFHALAIVPRMEKTPPKGMFKRGTGVRVWISDDAKRLPVKFQVEFKFGTGVATLARYRPPTAPAAAAVAHAENPHP